jgi:ribonuclease R
MARGTSVYFTDKVVPMLPRALSNGACSLNSGEEKYTLSAIIDLDGEGNIIETKLEESVIVSRVRGVYSEVNAVLSGDCDAELKKKYKPVMHTLLKMRELYELLRAKREARSYIDFDSDEACILLNSDGEPIDITLRQRGLSERMIEEFMLTANEAVARYMSEKNLPCVYRIHEKPPVDKYEELVRFAHNLGFTAQDIESGDPCAKKLALLLKKAEERGIGYPVSYMMLRSMSKAKYSEIRSDHFGLGLEYYCHFTSPIRRLSDLATHRILKAHLNGDNTERYRSYARRASAAASDAELRATGAERRIEDLYKVIYMSRYIGESFDGAVSSVSGAGMFVRLENTVVGLVPISTLPGEFFYDEGNMSLVSKKKVYRLGERVSVRVVECDIVRGNVEFELDYSALKGGE